MVILVAAEQYYSVTEILLASSRIPSKVTPGAHLETNYSPEYIVLHALRICGLAYTNENVSARVNAFGPLAFCKRFYACQYISSLTFRIGGRYLSESIHRNGLIFMLRDFAKPTGWPVMPIIEDLQRHWAMEDKSCPPVTANSTI